MIVRFYYCKQIALSWCVVHVSDDGRNRPTHLTRTVLILGNTAKRSTYGSIRVRFKLQQCGPFSRNQSRCWGKVQTSPLLVQKKSFCVFFHVTSKDFAQFCSSGQLTFVFLHRFSYLFSRMWQKQTNTRYFALGDGVFGASPSGILKRKVSK